MSLNLIGNGVARAATEGFIASGRIPHAMLIEGDEGTGRHILARYIAKSAVCEDKKAPCGSCRCCHLADVGSHPDISYLTPEDGKKNITVVQVRTLRAEAFVKPHMALKRVFIIDGADRMNEQAQNALLKVLEEPPAGVIFILICSSRTALLETIVSRCTTLSLIDKQDNENPTQSNEAKAAARFLELLFSGSELDMLRLLQPFEKDRIAADEFFSQLRLAIAADLRRNFGLKLRSKTLTALFQNIQKYEDSLKTNINLPLLFSAMVCESRQLCK